MAKPHIKAIVGRNESHMRYVQESRRSSECGFHGLPKKQQRRYERRKTKQALKQGLL